MNTRASVFAASLLALLLVACGKTEKAPESTTPPPPPPKNAPSGTDYFAGKYTGIWTPGKVGPSVVYGVKVTRSATSSTYDVEIEADGNQTMTRMRGEGRLPPAGSGEGAVLHVHFVSCLPDDMFECKGLSKGDELFTIAIVPDAYLLEYKKMDAPDLKTKSIPVQRAK